MEIAACPSAGKFSSLAAPEIVRDNSAVEAFWAQRVTAASATCSIPARGGLLLLVWVLLLLVGPRTVPPRAWGLG